MKGKWTEIYTMRKDVNKSYQEHTDGRHHGQGWACTCGCNKRVPGRRHKEGPPREECESGFIPTTGGASAAYRNGYSLIRWND